MATRGAYGHRLLQMLEDESDRTQRLVIQMSGNSAKALFPKPTQEITITGFKIMASVSTTSGTTAYGLSGTLYRISNDGVSTTTIGAVSATGSAATTTPVKINGADAAISDPVCSSTQMMMFIGGATTLVDDGYAIELEYTQE